MRPKAKVSVFLMILVLWAIPLSAAKPKKAAAKAAATKTVRNKKAAASPASASTPAPTATAPEKSRAPVSKGSVTVAPPMAEAGDVRHYPYKLNTGLGVDVLSGLGSAFHIGGQFGIALWEGKPIYVGPDVGFSLFSPASILTLAPSIWYEFRIYGAPRLSMSVGAGAGMALASSTSQLDSITYLGFIEATIIQQINELASVRGQLRPVMVGGYFGVNVNLTAQFRFQ